MLAETFQRRSSAEPARLSACGQAQAAGEFSPDAQPARVGRDQRRGTHCQAEPDIAAQHDAAPAAPTVRLSSLASGPSSA